jgi:hypothetical protein
MKPLFPLAPRYRLDDESVWLEGIGSDCIKLLSSSHRRFPRFTTTDEVRLLQKLT